MDNSATMFLAFIVEFPIRPKLFRAKGFYRTLTWARLVFVIALFAWMSKLDNNLDRLYPSLQIGLDLLRKVMGPRHPLRARPLPATPKPGSEGREFCEYDASPETTLAAVCAHEGPLLVDLDETLYLSNSTEDFIDCARPGLLALLLLRVLDLFRPWRLTGGVETADTWRVCAIYTFLPWTRWRWRANVPFLAECFVNRDLRAALRARAEPPVILTTGFKSVVAPLVAAMGFADAKVIAARASSFADRRNGKLHMAKRELGTETVSRCLIVSDSTKDLEVMRACARPLRTLWPRSRYRRALSEIYLPGEYISKVKRPGQKYIQYGIAREDFSFWLLSSIGLAINPITHFFGLLLLLLSFWAVYERGYVDNDLIAFRYEQDPTLSSAFGSVRVGTPAMQPWIWALLAGAAGVVMLRPDRMGFVVHFVCWVAVLILTHACFAIYNRIDKMTRIWIYPLLQFARSAAFTVIVPIEPAGVAALGAHLMSRWIPYKLYRLTSTGWPNVRPELVRLIAFVLLSLMMVPSLGPSALLTWTALGLLLWNALMARHAVYEVFCSARRLDRVHRPSTAQPREDASAFEQTTK